MARSQPLAPDFYDRSVVEVAQDLIGCIVTHGRCSGVIVETEAYHDSEPACHAYIGLTPRTAVLFGPPGRAYVYFSYGVHTMLNAVCEAQGVGAAVLIRALEPLAGMEEMARRRGIDVAAATVPDGAAARNLCSGPGKLTQALGIGLSDNGSDLRTGPIAISGRPAGRPPIEVVAGRRIGITKAVELPWRFCAAGSRYLSRPVGA